MELGVIGGILVVAAVLLWFLAEWLRPEQMSAREVVAALKDEEALQATQPPM